MNLTSFVEQSDVRENFKKEFKKPTIPRRKDPVVMPQTKNFGIVGTAFDYLLRFYVKSLNPQAVEPYWIAENCLRPLKQTGLSQLYKRGYLIVTQARENYVDFLQSQQISDDLLRSTLLLAKLDSFYRAGKIDENLEQVDERDIEDLRKLLSMVAPNPFKSSGVVLLNPTFVSASVSRIKADADLVIDDLLIEIKTVKELSLESDDFRQLMGYYALSQIEGIEGAPPEHEIKRLGIYFSRYAYFHVMNVEDLIDKQRFPQFLEWFKLRANS